MGADIAGVEALAYLVRRDTVVARDAAATRHMFAWKCWSRTIDIYDDDPSATNLSAMLGACRLEVQAQDDYRAAMTAADIADAAWVSAVRSAP